MDASSIDTPASAGRSIGRALWFAAGWLCFGVGVVGVVLPGIPTTGPMLLALACFARSSPRFHDWLLHHRYLGPPLQRYKRDGVIPLRAKVIAIAMMTLSATYLLAWSPLPMWAAALSVGFIVVGAVYTLRHPHRVATSALPASGLG